MWSGDILDMENDVCVWPEMFWMTPFFFGGEGVNSIRMCLFKPYRKHHSFLYGLAFPLLCRLLTDLQDFNLVSSVAQYRHNPSNINLGRGTHILDLNTGLMSPNIIWSKVSVERRKSSAVEKVLSDNSHGSSAVAYLLPLVKNIKFYIIGTRQFSKIFVSKNANYLDSDYIACRYVLCSASWISILGAKI